jgi:hypothetical protein
MVRYRRNRIAGGKFFFTLTLADRQSTALVDHVGALRAAFRATRTPIATGNAETPDVASLIRATLAVVPDLFVVAK